MKKLSLRLYNDMDAGGGGGGGGMPPDALASAVAEIGEGLGFSADTNEDLPSTKEREDATGPGEEAATTAESEQTDAKGTPTEEGKGGPAPAPAATAPATTPATGGPTAAPKPADINAIPDTWKSHLKEKFAALDPELKAEIHRREGDIFKGVEQWRQAADVGQRYHNAMAPFMPILRAHNIDPIEHVNTLMSAHHSLSVGTQEQKLDMFRRIGKEYGLDIAKLVEQEAAAASGDTYETPEVKALRLQLESVNSRLSAREQAEQQQRVAEISRKVDAFANDPANVYFEEVYQQMVPLIRANPGIDLKAAYEQALWANPITRGKENARLQQQEREAAAAVAAKQKEQDDARAKAAKKSSGFGVKSSPKSVGGAAKPGSMDDTLEETLAAINARSAA